MAITIFKIEMLSPPSTKVPLAQNVCYDDRILLWKWDLGTWGGKHSFLQIYTDFVQHWLKIIDWHSQLNIVQCSLYIYGHKYQTSCFLSSTNIQLIWLHSLHSTSPQKIDMPFISVPSQLLVFSVSFILFSLVPNKHRIQLLAMLNLALFKEPAL